MRDVVIVGGGLTGLSAAYELEKQRIPYTLIEVKRRLGGSIQTVRQDGFVMDGAAFAIDASIYSDPLIEELLLRDEFFPVAECRASHRLAPTDNIFAFKHGTEALIQAIASKLTAPRLMRMAVSSIGEIENGRYALCLENGLLLDAKSIILAVPARYAERMFYGYINDISKRLAYFRYEFIVRVSLGLRAGHEVDTSNLAFAHATAQPERVPAGHTLMQIGIRAEASQFDTLIDVVDALSLTPPVTRHVHHPSESDPLYPENHAANMAEIRSLLPPGVVLVGSDYTLSPGHPGVANLADRLQQGRQAAQQIAAFLKGKS